MGNVRNNLDYQVIAQFCNEHGLSMVVKHGGKHPKARIADRMTWPLASSPGKPNPHEVRANFRRACVQRGLITEG